MSTTTNIAAVTLTDDLFQTPMYLVESPYDAEAFRKATLLYALDPDELDSDNWRTSTGRRVGDALRYDRARFYAAKTVMMCYEDGDRIEHRGMNIRTDTRLELATPPDEPQVQDVAYWVPDETTRIMPYVGDGMPLYKRSDELERVITMAAAITPTLVALQARANEVLQRACGEAKGDRDVIDAALDDYAVVVTSVCAVMEAFAPTLAEDVDDVFKDVRIRLMPGVCFLCGSAVGHVQYGRVASDPAWLEPMWHLGCPYCGVSQTVARGKLARHLIEWNRASVAVHVLSGGKRVTA